MKDTLFDEIMKIHNNKRNFNLLVADFKAGRIVPFIGAGFSCPQFPSWNTLIRENSKRYGIEDEWAILDYYREWRKRSLFFVRHWGKILKMITIFLYH